MAWMVLPNPISSARIPLIPCSNKLLSHLKPLIWYSLRVPWKELGAPTNYKRPWSTKDKSNFSSFLRSYFYRLSNLLAIIWSTLNLAASSSISSDFSGGGPSLSSYFLWSASTPNLVAMKCEYSPDWYIIYCNLLSCFRAYCSSSSLFFNSASNFSFFFFN